ncbi:MAG: hypothetical protein OER88_05770 [Planctomycetota bacterium]|nr:hypothetical protein [Planctomycetota bacterium]
MEESVYTYCAWAGGVLIVLQVVLQVFGIFDGSDVDLDLDADVDVDVDGIDGADGHGDWFFGVLSFKALTAFAAFFGITGLALLDGDMGQAGRIVTATGVGFASMLIVGWMMRAMYRLGSSGTVRTETALGRTATVYLRIPAASAGRGKITVEVSGRTMELEAFTDGGELATGARVTVLAVDGSGIAKVAPA